MPPFRIQTSYDLIADFDQPNLADLILQPMLNSTVNTVPKSLLETNLNFVRESSVYATEAGRLVKYIPIVLDPATQNTVAIPILADQEIMGVVVAADTGQPTTDYDTRVFEPNDIVNAATHTRLTCYFGRLVCLAEYTGAAPSVDPTDAIELNRVVTSATAGSVALATTATIATNFGKKVVAVSTALGVVAYVL